MKTLSAIVPARGGSRRFPGKNLHPFLGKPLIYHAIDSVVGVATRVVVMSDSDDIIEAASAYGNSDVYGVQLPSWVTTDTSTVLEAVTHMVCERHFCGDTDVLGVFLPTAPLRTSGDVSNALHMMEDSIDGVVSTTDYEFPPRLGLVVDGDGSLKCFDPSKPFLTGNTRSQAHRDVIRPNGAIYLRWTDRFKKDKNFFAGNVHSYHMPRERSPDIDTQMDLKIAEMLAHGQIS